MATNRKALYQYYGDPFTDKATFEKKWMLVFNVGNHFKWCPFKKMYINYELISPIINTYTLLELKGLHTEIKTYDGCFNRRCIRGYENPCIPSIHSWALAIDHNAKDNPLGVTREEAIARGLKPFSEAFLDVWRETGWTVGYDFGRKDGMHFQWTRKWEV